MQYRMLFVFAGFIALMIALTGCSTSNSLTSSGSTTLLSGIVETPTGSPVANTTVTLYSNGSGASAGTQTPGSTGLYSCGVPAGTYTIEVTGALVGEATFWGTLTVGSTAQTLNLVTPTAMSQLPGNVTAPNDGSATLVVQSVNANGVPTNQSFSVTVGSQTTTSATNGTTAYADIPEVSTTMGITSVVVTPTNGSPSTVNNLSFQPGNVVLLDAVF